MGSRRDRDEEYSSRSRSHREGDGRSRDDRTHSSHSRKDTYISSDRNDRDDWQNLRIKEEPASDVEGINSRSHSRHNRSRSNRSRSRSPRNSRDRRVSDQRSPVHSRRRSTSPGRQSTSGDRSSFRRPEERPRREDRRGHHREDAHDREGRNTGRESQSQPPQRSRDRPAREKDWENFFNPNTETGTRQEPEDEDSKYGKKDSKDSKDPKLEKEKPNFGLSGKLTEETNTFRGVVIKYSEPPEARKPQKIRWRLYPFKGEEALPVMYVHRQSAYLLGRERKIADIPIDHPSCSKQHAVLQYRLMKYERADGSVGRRIKPYIIDLESGNGTFVNGKQIEAKRYVELFEKDVLKFGFSTREYVLLHEHSKDEPDEDEFENSPEVDEKVRVKAEEERD